MSSSSPAPDLPDSLLEMQNEILGIDKPAPIIFDVNASPESLSQQDFSSDDSIKDRSYQPNKITSLQLRKFYESSHNFLTPEDNASDENIVRELPSDYYSSPQESPKICSRKRIRNPNLWKQNMRKRLRQSGKNYTTAKGVVKSPKSVGPACLSNCFFSCSKYISKKDREAIHKVFWQLTDEGKKCFFSKFVKQEECKNRRSTTDIDRTVKKGCSFNYSLEASNRIFRTCKKFFLNTLDVSERRIYYYFKYCHDKTSGVPLPTKKPNCGRKSTPEEKIYEVKSHIESFPRIESHYCRSNTTRQYLESHLNLQKMYSLYKEKLVDPVALHVYRNIFNTRFNFSFHVPKKDQCDKCSLFRLKQREADFVPDESYELHLKEKQYLKAERDCDRKNIDTARAVVCYDLQNVFPLPRGYASNFYYKRKLCTFNLTATLILPYMKKITYCAIWNETLSGRSGNDVASALITILVQILKEYKEVKEFILWSDSCVPQNRNQITSVALLQLLHDNKNLELITQKFSEPGHSLVQQIDCVHSVIEKYLKNLEIGSQLTLIKHLKNLKTENVKLEIIQMKNCDFKMFSKKSSEFAFNQIPFTKCKLLQYKQQDLTNIYYKISAALSDFQKVCIQKQIRGRFIAVKNTNHIFNEVLNIAISKPISKDKVDDLKTMLKYLPEIDKKYFQAILKL